MKPITSRIKDELEIFQLTETQILGFMFHLGYGVDRHARYIGAHGKSGVEIGMMKNNPLSYLLDDEYEIEDNLLEFSNDSITSCYFTFAKVIHEDWVKSDDSIESLINVGPEFLFTGEIDDLLWNNCSGNDFNGVNIDQGFLLFFERIGQELTDLDITDIKDALWYGKDLNKASVIDDPMSYSYVVDKLNTLMSPYLKMILNYPILFELNTAQYENDDLFSNIFNSTLKLEKNKTIRELCSKWQAHIMRNENGVAEVYLDFDEENLGYFIWQMSNDGFQFKNSLNANQFEEIKNAGDVFKLVEFEGKDVDLNTFATIIAQIMHQQYGYDYRIKNWSNYGAYLQYLSFYFLLSMRYSVYFNNLIENN
jgi:hypothetical protein